MVRQLVLFLLPIFDGRETNKMQMIMNIKITHLFDRQLKKPADEYLVIEVWNQEKRHGGDPVGGKGLKKFGK